MSADPPTSGVKRGAIGRERTSERSEMDTLDMTLRFGLRGAAPPDASAVWGARWIYPDDAVWDRQDCVGAKREREALLAWLSERAGARPALRARRLHETGRLRSTGGEQVTLFEDERGIVAANPRRSAGYLYLAAWLKPGQP